MTKKNEPAKISIDGVDYSLDSLTENAKSHIAYINFVDAQIQQLNNEWAIADTARIGYQRALDTELKKIDPKA